MTDDVLAKERLEDAMEALLAAPARARTWTGPKWAAEVLNIHPGIDADHVAGCDQCQRAWKVMVAM